MGRAGAPLGARGVGAGVAHAAGMSVAALYDALGRSAGYMHVTGMWIVAFIAELSMGPTLVGG